MTNMSYTLAALREAESGFAQDQDISKKSLDFLQDIRSKIDIAGQTDSQKIAAWIVAPVLAGFTRWMTKQIEPSMTVLGVMREGGTLCALMRDLFGTQAIEASFNRHFCMLAAYACGDDEAMVNWLVRTRIAPLTHAELQHVFPKHKLSSDIAQRPIDVVEAQRLVNTWREMGAASPVHEPTQSAKDKILAYWQHLTEGHKPDQVVLMDFACAGNIQRSLQTILNHQSKKTQSIGLNFVTTRGTAWAKSKGCDIRGFLAQDGEPKWIADAYARAPEVMEIFAATPLGPLIDYDDRAQPVRGDGLLNQAQNNIVVEWQNNIRRAAKIYNDEMGSELTPELCRIIWGRFLLSPLPGEVMALADWPLDCGLVTAATRTLAPRLDDKPEDWSKMQTGWPAASLLRQILRI